MTLAVLLGAGFSSNLVGSDQVSMEGPLVDSHPEEVIMTTCFWNFLPGKLYRLGIGTSGQPLSGTQLELFKGQTRLSKSQKAFDQGFTENWFEVKQVKVQGFYLEPDNYPDPGAKLMFKVVVQREALEKLDGLFLVLSQQFGPDVRYVVDGCEVSRSCSGKGGPDPPISVSFSEPPVVIPARRPI